MYFLKKSSKVVFLPTCDFSVMKFDGEHGIFTKLLIQTSLPSWGLMPFPLVKSST